MQRRRVGFAALAALLCVLHARLGDAATDEQILHCGSPTACWVQFARAADVFAEDPMYHVHRPCFRAYEALRRAERTT